jgi:hypothetical protein
LVGKAQQNPGQEGHTPSRNELETGALLLLPSGIISQENTTAHKATGRRACWHTGGRRKSRMALSSHETMLQEKTTGE